MWCFRFNYFILEKKNNYPAKYKSNYFTDYVKVKELYELGYNDKEIGKQVGTSSSSIFRWRRKNNLPINSKK